MRLLGLNKTGERWGRAAVNVMNKRVWIYDMVVSRGGGGTANVSTYKNNTLYSVTQDRFVNNIEAYNVRCILSV